MAPESVSTAAQIYQFKLTLLGARPAVWRRLLVASDATIADLHSIIQIAMGWENYHLHCFVINGAEYGVSYSGGPISKGNARLSDFRFDVGDSFQYQYDFGDSWDHDIRIEKISKPDANATYPSCTAGSRACPPEDCGGVWGYMEIVRLLRKKSSYGKRRVREMIGSSFDPTAFDRGEVNKELQSRLVAG